jgi:hypothetical protein
MKEHSCDAHRLDSYSQLRRKHTREAVHSQLVTSERIGDMVLRSISAEDARRVAILKHPEPIPDTQLANTTGRSLRLSDHASRAVVVEFIYTQCPLICTSLGDAFAQLQDATDKPGFAAGFSW